MKLISVLSLFVFIACAQANNGEGASTTEIPCNSGFFLQANHSGQFYYTVFLLQPDFTPPHTKAHTLYANLKSFGYCEPIHFKSTCLSESESGNPETLLLFISPPPEQGVNIAVACWRLSLLHSRGSPLPSDFSPSVSRSSRHGKQYAVQYQGEEWELSYHGEHGLQHVMTRDGIKKTHGTVCTTAHFEKSPLQTPLLMWLPSISNFPQALSDEVRQQLRQIRLIADVVLACKVSGSPTLTLASTQEGEEDSERITRQCAAISLDHSTVTETQACSRASTEPFIAPPEESFSDLLHNSGFLQKDCRILCRGATELFNQLSQVERDELYLTLLTKSMVPPLVNTTNDMLTLFSNLQKHMGEPWDYQGLLCWLGLAAKKHGQRLSVQTVNTLRVYEPMTRRWIDAPCVLNDRERINNLKKCLVFTSRNVEHTALTKELMEFFLQQFIDQIPVHFRQSSDEKTRKLWMDIHVELGTLICTDLCTENNALLITFLGHYLRAVRAAEPLYAQTMLIMLPDSCRKKTMCALEATVLTACCTDSQPDDYPAICAGTRSMLSLYEDWQRVNRCLRQQVKWLETKLERMQSGIVQEEQLPIVQQLESHCGQLEEQILSWQRAYSHLQHAKDEEAKLLKKQVLETHREIEALSERNLKDQREIVELQVECRMLSSSLKTEKAKHKLTKNREKHAMEITERKLSEMRSILQKKHERLLEQLQSEHQSCLRKLTAQKETAEKKIESAEAKISDYQARLEVHQSAWPKERACILQVRSQLESSFFQLQQYLHTLKTQMTEKELVDFEKYILQIEEAGASQWASLQKILKNESIDIIYLKCVICLDQAQEAYVGSECGHIYCKFCIEEYLKNSRYKLFGNCAYCKKTTRFQKIYN
ncbi:RING finger protein [Spongorhabdus nitratireducens]